VGKIFYYSIEWKKHKPRVTRRQQAPRWEEGVFNVPGKYGKKKSKKDNRGNQIKIKHF